MVLPSVWGPPVWCLFHVLTVNLKEESFNVIGKVLFHYIKRLCNFLPCVECSIHSKIFFSKLNDSSIDTKIKLMNTLYVFHNIVNKKKHKNLYNYEDVVPRYNNLRIINVYNNFVKIYNTKGNLNQINESFHRQRLLLEFKKWLIFNLKHFNNI